MKRTRTIIGVASVALALALGGCGGGGSSKRPKSSKASNASLGHRGAGPRSQAHGSPAAPAATKTTATLTVENGRPGHTIPPSFVGLSFEYWNLPTYAGTNPNAIDPVLTHLVRNLSPGSPPSVRIGGVSTDHAWAPLPGMSTPPWAKFTITKAWLALARAFVKATDARLLLGVNFEADNSAIASAESRALVDGIGGRSIAGLELGNEPELYAGFPWYRTAADVHVRGRSASVWTPAFAAQQYASVAHTLTGAPIAGPAVGSPKWIGALSTLLQANPEIRTATIHAYPLKRCSATTHVTIAQLLDRMSSDGLAAKEAAAAQTAQGDGVPIRVAEMNSVSCGGEAGVSDTFASALWSVDALFALANVGIDGVNLHSTPAVPNHLFNVEQHVGQWVGQVYPIYYGLEMFNDAAPPGSRIVPVKGSVDPTLRVWATHGADGTTRIALINTASSGAQNVTVHVRNGAQVASVQRLTAPGLGATGGVALNGESFGSQTTTGVMSGSPATQSVSVYGGDYKVTVAPASAALLTVGSG